MAEKSISTFSSNPEQAIFDYIGASRWIELERLLKTQDEQCLQALGKALANRLNDVPMIVRLDRPWLDYCLGKALMQSDLPQAIVILKRAYSAFLNCGDIEGECRAISGILDGLWLEWDDCRALDPWLDRLTPTRHRLEQAGRKDLLIALSRSAFAGLSIRRPGDQELVFWETWCLRGLSRDTYTPNFRMRGLQLMVHYTWGIGDRAHSTLVLETLHSKQGKSDSDPISACIFHVVQAAHRHWFDADIEACAETVRTGLAVSKSFGLPHWDIPMLNCVLFKASTLERSDEIHHWLEQLGHRIQLNPRPHDQAIHYHFRAYLAWIEGHHDEAITFAFQAYRIAVDSGFAYSPVYYGLALTAIWAESNQRPKALAELARLRRMAEIQNSDVMRFMVLMQGAAIMAHKGRYSGMHVYLSRALRIGARQRYFSCPWVRRSKLAQLLAEAIAAGLEVDYAQSLIKALRLTPPDGDRVLALNWPWPHKVRILGGVEIHSESSQAKPQNGKSPASLHRLLFQLVAAGPDGVNSERLQDRLWPDAGEQAYARLKTGLNRLRSLFGDKDAIIHAQQRIKLNLDKTWVDTWALEQAAMRRDELDTVTLLNLLNIWRGIPDTQLLENVDDICYTVKVEDAYLALLNEATRRLENDAKWEQALRLWRQAAAEIDHEPVLEGQARCLKALGRISEAEAMLSRLVE